MASSLQNVCCASIPQKGLALLAAMRCEPGLVVAEHGQHWWVRWKPGNETVLRAVLPIPGCHLFVPRAGIWFPLGKHLPEEVPVRDFRPLAQVLFPAPVPGVPVPRVKIAPMSLTLVPEDQPRPATALRCTLGDLLAWVYKVPNPRLAQLQATHCGANVVVLGRKLPELSRGQRYWGLSVLIPLGYRLEPRIMEHACREVLGLEAGDIALCAEDQVDIIPGQALAPLRRADLRLAWSREHPEARPDWEAGHD